MIDFTKPLRVKGCEVLGARVVDRSSLPAKSSCPPALVVITERDGNGRIACVRVEFEEGQYDD